jgi:hypothetical protein
MKTIVLYSDKKYKEHVLITIKSFSRVKDKFRFLFFQIDFFEEVNIDGADVQCIFLEKPIGIPHMQLVKPLVLLRALDYCSDYIYVDCDTIISKNFNYDRLVGHTSNIPIGTVLHETFWQYPVFFWYDSDGVRRELAEEGMMEFLNVTHRSQKWITTLILGVTSDCLNFLKEWNSLCLNSELWEHSDTLRKIGPEHLESYRYYFHMGDETPFNVLLWKYNVMGYFLPNIVLEPRKLESFLKLEYERLWNVQLESDNPLTEVADSENTFVYHQLKDIDFKNSILYNFKLRDDVQSSNSYIKSELHMECSSKNINKKIMKIAILTAYTDTNNWTSDGTCDFMQVSSKNHVDYCYANNYTYICELFKENDYTGYHPTWIKILALKKYLDNYDYVVWVDSDCVFTDIGISIESFITDSNISTILPKCEKDYNTNTVWTGITTGFMILKNDEFSKNLLDTLLESASNYKNDYFHEQSVLDNYLRSRGYYDNIPSLLNNMEDDLEAIHYSNNVGFLPYSYHRYVDDGNCKFMYHAGGNSLTKKERLETILNVNETRFGIYTSFYNCEEFVENAFTQIESLNYDNFEWHITDDFSDDMTKDLVLDRLSKSPISHKIKYYDQSLKKQMYWAPNEFFDNSFDWIVLIDTDDEVDVNFLKLYNSIIRKKSDITLISSDFHKISYPNNELHSIGYILNDEPISLKIERYHPNCDYLNNISYSCFGHLRAFKNLSKIKFEINDRFAGAEDSYHVFWVNSYGKYLHIPRPLYKWNMHDKSESHSTNVLPNFNGNFDMSLNKLKKSDFGVDIYYNDIYIETSALTSYPFNRLSGKSVSIWTRTLTQHQKEKLTELYFDVKLSFNDITSDIHIICINYFSDNILFSFIENIREKSVLSYYQNSNKYYNSFDLDSDVDLISKKYVNEFIKVFGSIYWWQYIRHLVIMHNV